jgi:hypothetical protein
MSETELRDLFTRDDLHTDEPPLPDGFAGTSLDRARHRVRARRRARFALSGVAVVAAAAVAALVVTTAGPAGPAVRPYRQPAAAAPDNAQLLLGRVALAADDQTVTVRDDQFIYSDTLAQYTSYTKVNGKMVGQLQQPYHETLWLPVDNAKTGVSRIGTKDYRDRTPGSITSPDYHFLQTLPTDPDRLLALLRAAVAPDLKYAKAKHATADDLLWAQLTSLATQPVMPPKLAAAVYQAAAKVPGITLVKDTTDASGRHGIGVSHHIPDVDDVTQTWIFDPKTYQYLGEREVGTAGGSLHGLTALLSHGVVDQLGQLPK